MLLKICFLRGGGVVGSLLVVVVVLDLVGSIFKVPNDASSAT